MSRFRTLRAGVFLPPFHPNDEDPLLCMERDFQLMQWLDMHNYAEAWIGEHHSGGYEIYGQPELFIATAAERTRHIRLGTAEGDFEMRRLRQARMAGRRETEHDFTEGDGRLRHAGLFFHGDDVHGEAGIHGGQAFERQ